MTDFRYKQIADISKNTAVQLDWLMTPLHQIADGASLQSAMIIALGTDALAGVSDELPGLDDTDRRGWWGDMDAEEIWGGWPVGSKLWLLQRTKITGPMSKEGDTVAKADEYTRAAMNPFVDNKIASQIDVTASRTDIGRIDVSVVVNRGPEPDIALRYAELWGELGTS